MVIAFVWILFFLALFVRLSSRESEIVAFALAAPVVMLAVDILMDRGKAPKRPMVAFAVVAPWLTFDVRGWWTEVGTAWDQRLHSAHGVAIISGNWDHAADRHFNELLRGTGFAAGTAALSWLAWWAAGKVDWSKHLSKLRAVGVFAAVSNCVMIGLLAMYGRALPMFDPHQPRRLQAVATVFDFRHGEPPPPEVDGRRHAIDLGEGVTAVRECHPGCQMSLVRPPHASCTLEQPNLRSPVVLRRDARLDLWFFDDGVDLLAYRGADLRCIDLSLRDVLLHVKPSSAWLWGGGMGLALALLAWTAARARTRHEGPDAPEQATRVVVSLEAFAVAILFAAMPPVISTLLGAFVW